MNSNMPKDSNGNPIPILGKASAKTINATVSDVLDATAYAEDGNSKVAVTFIAIDDIWVNWGTGTPTAVAEADDSVYLPAGTRETYPLSTGDKIAVTGGKLNYIIAQ